MSLELVEKCPSLLSATAAVAARFVGIAQYVEWWLRACRVPSLAARMIARVISDGLEDGMFHDPQIILFSDDIQRATEFYSQLGFTETFRVPQEEVPIHVDLALDGYKIGIASGASTRDDHGLEPLTTGQRAAVILWTDDTRAAYQHLTEDLKARGLQPPHVWLGRLLIAWVEDPDGNPIQIVQHLAPTPSQDPT